MSDPLDHIAAWEAAGLIDAQTGVRLRAAATTAPPASEAAVVPSEPTIESARTSNLVAVFGPGLAVGEMFGYLGVIFILSAWTSFVVRTLSNGDTVNLGYGACIAAVGLAILGWWLGRTDDRGRRAAGVAYLVAVAYLALAAASFVGGLALGWPLSGVIVALVAFGAAVAARAARPSLVTQAAMLAGLAGLAGSTLTWIESVIAPSPLLGVLDGSPIDATGGVGGTWSAGQVGPLAFVVISALWWLGTAVVIGYFGLREAHSSGVDPAAGRRAALSRLTAGLVAVYGLWSAVSRSDFSASFDYARVLAPWLGDLAIFILSAVLVERAFRRGSGAYAYAAAVGLIVALTDLNFSYLSGTTEVAFLIEGLILLGAGVVADRLRRRVSKPGDDAPPEPPYEPPSPAAAALS